MQMECTTQASAAQAANFAGNAQTNPFLRVNQPAVRAALAAELGEAPADALAAFTALREWKNRF